MSSPSRGRRALLLVAVLLAIPLLGAAGTWLWIQRTADRKWAEAKLRIQELSRTFPGELPPHPSTELSKELQIHFVAAIRDAARRSTRQKVEAGNLVRLRQDVDAVDSVLGDARDFLDRLHEGARRCASTPEEFPPGWRGEWDEATLAFVMNCAVLRARRLRETGAPAEAAEALLDSLQLARFWAASGKGDNRLHAIFSLDRPLDGLRDLLSNETLSRDELLRIDRELEPLDAALRPPSFYLETTLARWAEELDAWDLEATGVMTDAPYRWRYLLPKHLMKTEAFEFHDRHIQRLIVNEGRPYLELKNSVYQYYLQARESKNPILASADIVHPLEWSVPERTAQLRLLRVATRYRATGEFLRLKDPFGGEFLHRKIEHRTKFWSPGKDGQDDGGDSGSQPGWFPDRSAPPPRPAKDIVIDVIG